MQKLKALICSILLLTILTLFAYPSHHISGQQAHAKEKGHQLTYDEILDILDQLESGELEENGTSEELQRVNHLLALLAKQGVLPVDPMMELAVQADIEDLLSDSSIEWASFNGDIRDFELILKPPQKLVSVYPCDHSRN